jgi:anti-anti-sigma factor
MDRTKKSDLLVETDVQVREDVLEALRDSPFAVCAEARDVAGAVHLCRELQPRIVVFPLTGVERIVDTLARFKAASMGTRLVATYDFPHRYLVVTAMNAGVVACLRKPFDAPRLLAVLDRADRSRGRAAAASAALRRAAARRWPGRLREDGFMARWHEAAISDLSAEGLTITADERLIPGRTLEIEIDLPRERGSVRGHVEITDVKHLPSRLYRARATLARFDTKARRSLAASLPRRETERAQQQTRAASLLPAEALPQESPGLRASVRPAGDTPGTYVIALAGAMDAMAIEPVEQALAQMPLKNVRIVFDMAAVEQINSSGIGILLSIVGRTSRMGGHVMLAAVRTKVRMVLDIISAGDLLAIAPDVEAALAALREDSAS